MIVLIAACGTAELPPPAKMTEQSVPAAVALRASKFEEAGRIAASVLAREPRDSRAAAIRAVTAYQRAADDLVKQLSLVIEQGDSLKALDHAKGRRVWQTFLDRLDDVDADLAIAAADPAFSLEICLACLENDWNHSGKIDERDQRLLELEFDGKGGELAEDDLRRRPTYRFDVGDVEWARAMVSFQRAAVEIVLAYQWGDLDKLFAGDADEARVVIRITDKARVRKARTLILAALDAADRCREAYLAETDDDREWVPNPRQKSFAMPLEVDAALYETWRGVIGDVRRMLESKEGISLREAMALISARDADLMPDAYVDLGAMLRDPKDIVVDFSRFEHHVGDKRANIEAILKDVLGNGYRKSMKPSPLVTRFRRMRDELVRGEDTWERKLRFLIWLN